MAEITFVWPIAAGKEEEGWRHVLQELGASRSAEFGRMRRRLGIVAVGVWLQRSGRGRLAVVHVEAEDPLGAASMLAVSPGAGMLLTTTESWRARRISPK